MNVNGVRLFPLTNAQLRLWYTELLYPNTTLGTLSATVFIQGKIKIDILQESIRLVIQQNEALRTRIVEHSGEPKQYVEPYAEREIEFQDFSELHNKNDAEEWLDLYNRKPIELIQSELFEFVLFKMSNHQYGYNFKIHHIVSDGISMNLVGNQIAQNYTALINETWTAGDQIESYFDYIITEQEYLNSQRYQKDRAYWLDKFQTIPDVISIKPFNPLSSDTVAKRNNVIINSELYSAFTAFCQQNKISMFTFFLSAFYIYVHKVTNQNDIAIGTVYANRTTKKEKETVGMFASTAATRLFVDPETDLFSFLQRVAKEQSAILRHQKYPYNQLIQDIREHSGSKDLNRLFGIAVEYQLLTLLDVGQMKIQSRVNFCGHEGNDLTLHIKEILNDQLIILDVHYRSCLFSEDEVQRMLEQIIMIAEKMIRYPHHQITEVSLLSIEEKNTILNKFNASAAEYPREKTVHQLFEEQVERTQDKAAVIYEGSQLTYRELNERANQLARTLRARGVQVDDRVAIMAERSLEMIVGIFGILKAGGAYVPIDPEYPAERIRYMLEDSGAKLVLSQRCLQDRISYVGDTLFLDESIYDTDSSNLTPLAGPDHLAYVIYTSGSTGQPKGVLTTQQNIVRTVVNNHYLTITPEDRILQLSNYAFDGSAFDIFGALLNGALLVLIRKEHILDIAALSQILKEEKITIFFLTT
ncbi:non-ribosomal peptide synthetase, partial [Paenibacillus fonticola]|uniref:non-ribosomal peptide synthetase n=1 Tax=Paenibacillus fonticola TaxID=379896 RepID=UPI0009FE755E